jgi:hypothetical protein
MLKKKDCSRFCWNRSFASPILLLQEVAYNTPFFPSDDVNHFQGGKSSRARGNNNIIQGTAVDSPVSQLPSQTMEGESSLSGQASEYEEAESGLNFWLLVLCNGK